MVKGRGTLTAARVDDSLLDSVLAVQVVDCLRLDCSMQVLVKWLSDCWARRPGHLLLESTSWASQICEKRSVFVARFVGFLRGWYRRERLLNL